MKPQRPRKLDFSDNLRFAKRFVSQTLPPVLREQLRELTRNSSFSLRHGDLILLSSGWYVTHTGLIRLAARRRCRGIQVQPISEFSDTRNGRYVFKATVYKSPTCKGFVGYGDADPSNVSFLVHGAEMRQQAVAAYFQRQDASEVLYREWAAHRDSNLHYSERDSWDRMLQSGVQLLE